MIPKYSNSINMHLHCEPKNTPKCFLSYLLQNSTKSDKIWYILSRVNLSYKNANVFYGTWIMSLHYLVKLSSRWRRYPLPHPTPPSRQAFEIHLFVPRIPSRFKPMLRKAAMELQTPNIQNGAPFCYISRPLIWLVCPTAKMQNSPLAVIRSNAANSS